LRPSPNHPEYAGAAAIIMTAATEVLADVFGDQFTFTIESPTLLGKPRTFARFSDLSTDVINARVYIGFHFRNSSMVGAAAGRQIAQLVFAQLSPARAEYRQQAGASQRRVPTESAHHRRAALRDRFGVFLSQSIAARIVCQS
jgi:hypothetical protein